MRERMQQGRPAPTSTGGRADARRRAAAPSPSALPAIVPGSGATRTAAAKALQGAIGNRAAGRLLAAPPPDGGAAAIARRIAPAGATAASRIQRVVMRGDGDRQRNVDLVNTVMGFRDFGVTPGRINAEEFPGGNAANAIVAPQLTATPAADGQTAVRVTAEPVNVVDYRMELPAAPPWQRAVNKGDVIPYVEMVAGGGYAARLQRLRDSATDATTFRVAGAPNDAAFSGLVETHEDRHVTDLWTTTDQILEPWDANLRQLRETDAPMTAPDEATARQMIYDAAGGTPAQIGQRMVDDMRDSGTAFHQTPAGGPPGVSDVTTGTAPNRLTLTWRHPLG